MIKWTNIKDAVPEADRELVAKNISKIVGVNSAAKRCKIMKFNKCFSKKQITDLMLGSGLPIWAYTDGGLNE